MPAVENGRTLAGVINELKVEAKEFAQTRVEMLRRELREKGSAFKAAVPVIGIGVVLLGTGWLLLTGALVAILTMAFYPSPFAPFFALLIVGAVYALAGGAMAYMGVQKIKSAGVVPERTVRVLKEDAAWIQSEARSQV